METLWAVGAAMGELTALRQTPWLVGTGGGSKLTVGLLPLPQESHPHPHSRPSASISVVRSCPANEESWAQPCQLLSTYCTAYSAVVSRE